MKNYSNIHGGKGAQEQLLFLFPAGVFPNQSLNLSILFFPFLKVIPQEV